MDIGLTIQLALVLGVTSSVGLMAFFAYRKGRKDEQAKQNETDLDHANKVEEISTRPELPPSAVRDELRNGEF